ncbi:MAG TPA: thiamine-phosphate kinase, partial [Chloroflexota bacterium]|nr:thiamine-phosphate kinase [Chloroflexota bacterium]
MPRLGKLGGDPKPNSRLAEIGELGAIRLFRELLASRPGNSAARPLIGIGDDAAVWQPTPGHAAIETTDLLIEEVHFSLRWFSWYEAGWKAMAVNVSDLAAMGGRPLAAFVSVGLKPDMGADEVLQLYTGLADCADEYQLGILGGDTVTSPTAAVINVALFGQTLDRGNDVLRRDRARPGDAIAVSGPLGAAAGFLRLQADELRPAQVHPRPRVSLGQALLRAGCRCAMDLSDGLLADLGKLCSASGVAAGIDAARVPLAPAVERLLPA